MKCIVPGVNLKVFGRAIHSLAKIGDELYFEPLEQGLTLRTVNSSRSAYACFLFFPSYFQHYDDGSRNCDSGDSEEEGLRCKLTMKSVMTVFRSLSTIEKTVERCKITHNAREARLVFELHCRHGIVKTHNLAYIECETLQAIFSKDLCPNKLTAPAKLLCEAVVNFQTTQEEITLTLRPDNVSLKNYLEDEPDPTKVVHTELSLVPEEFDQYQVGVDTDITFCLKELRAILAFAETAGLPLNIHFETAGRPVTFCVDGDQTFEASFVLATLAEADQSSSQQSQVKRPAQTSSASQQRSRSSASVRDARRDGGAKETHMRHGPSTSRKNESPRVDSSQQNGSSSQPPHPAPAADDAVADISAEELAAAMEMECEWEERPADRRQSDGQDAPSLPGDTAGRGDTSPEQGPSSPVIPVQSAGMSRVHDGPRLQPLENDETDEGDNLDDTIPGTPPAKKFRSLFFGSSQASTQPTQPLQQSTVLAADTDEESS
ncbi:hypothetical protein BaRGS_00002704 [Batillaria attramentaria]|uniref:Cell cycle checkpoint control protein RAD9A n=1 Tax=Batillaria attramentaria TaxID=370345 RepID=A0ABD0M2Q4_9CAEN